MTDSRPTILVVEDERMLCDLFASWLESEYDVLVAYDGETALEKLSDDVDMALLDRRMPGLSGDEVLSELRDQGYEFPVAMVTAVDPDFDIVDMGFDDYLVKPIEQDDLLTLVEELISLPTYEDAIQQYFQLASKKAALEASKSEAELANSDEYTALIEEYEDVKSVADSQIQDIDAEEGFSQL